MAAENLLRLAWQAERDGRPGLRDRLVTLAIVASGPDDAAWADRCRRRLIARRPDHWLAAFPISGRDQSHPRVAEALGLLRTTYPPGRVRRLLFRAEVRRGPFTGRRVAFSRILTDLTGSAPGSLPSGSHGDGPGPKPSATRIITRRAVGVAGGSGGSGRAAVPLPGDPPGAESDREPARDPAATGSLIAFYLTVLLAIAMLLTTVLRPSARDSWAA
jgi:hypothetical protein